VQPGPKQIALATKVPEEPFLQEQYRYH